MKSDREALIDSDSDSDSGASIDADIILATRVSALKISEAFQSTIKYLDKILDELTIEGQIAPEAIIQETKRTGNWLENAAASLISWSLDVKLDSVNFDQSIDIEMISIIKQALVNVTKASDKVIQTLKNDSIFSPSDHMGRAIGTLQSLTRTLQMQMAMKYNQGPAKSIGRMVDSISAHELFPKRTTQDTTTQATSVLPNRDPTQSQYYHVASGDDRARTSLTLRPSSFSPAPTRNNINQNAFAAVNTDEPGLPFSSRSSSDAGFNGQHTLSTYISIHPQKFSQGPTNGILWACPMCKSNPEFWFFVLECRGFCKENLKDLMRFHVFVGDRPDAGKFSFHEKYNNKLLVNDPDNPNIYDPKIFKHLRNWLANHGGRWDNRPYNEQRWRVMYDMLMQARKGGPTIPSTELEPYVSAAWLRAALQPKPRHAFTSSGAALDALNMTFSGTPDLFQYLKPHVYGFFERQREQHLDDMVDVEQDSVRYRNDLDLSFEDNMGDVGFSHQGVDLSDRATVPTIDIDHNPAANQDRVYATPRATFPTADIDHAAKIAAGPSIIVHAPSEFGSSVSDSSMNEEYADTTGNIKVKDQPDGKRGKTKRKDIYSRHIRFACPFFARYPDLWKDKCGWWSGNPDALFRHHMDMHMRLNQRFLRDDSRRIDQGRFHKIIDWRSGIRLKQDQLTEHYEELTNKLFGLKIVNNLPKL